MDWTVKGEEKEALVVVLEDDDWQVTLYKSL
jgi:hypothetical protein